METYTLKVTKGPGFPVKRVAVYNGLSPNEFAQLIGGALSIEYTKIVGLSVSGGGEVVPLSLACAMPALFADSTCIVLTSNKAGNLWALPQMAMRPLPAAQPEPPRLMSPAHYSASLSREKSRRFAMVAPAPSRYDLVAPAPLPPPPPPQQQQQQQHRCKPKKRPKQPQGSRSKHSVRFPPPTKSTDSSEEGVRHKLPCRLRRVEISVLCAGIQQFATGSYRRRRLARRTRLTKVAVLLNAMTEEGKRNAMTEMTPTTKIARPL
mmetsp:Transcript_40366/g.81416  ORF Transcript_40366/g.81416 Transcript_40366/m.81416 type:complete len:264 (+) Transcript_40366:66-857(+)